MADIDLNFDPDAVLKEAVGAAKAAISGTDWAEIKEYVKKSAKDLVNAGIQVQKLKLTGKINEDEAKSLIEEEKIVVRMKLRAIAGVTLLTVQNALNAVLQVLRDSLNAAIGWRIF